MTDDGGIKRRGTYRKPTDEEAATFAAINDQWLLWDARRKAAEAKRTRVRRIVQFTVRTLALMVAAAVVIAVVYGLILAVVVIGDGVSAIIN